MVADPRATDITEHATLHLRPRSGTDIAMLNGLMHIILEKGWEDRAFIEAHTENFEAFRASLADYIRKPPQSLLESRLSSCTMRPRSWQRINPWPWCTPWASPSIRLASRMCWQSQTCRCCWATWESRAEASTRYVGKTMCRARVIWAGCPMSTRPTSRSAAPEARAKFEAAWGTELSRSGGMTPRR